MGVREAAASPSSRWTGASRRWIDALLLVAVLALFAADVRRPRSQIDDAFISYQYARNLVEGHGLVFNPGEYVEGYTNLLWTLLVAGGMALGRRAEWLGWVLGATSGAATLVATYFYATAVLEATHAWAGAVACGVVLAAASFGVWTLQGMETPLFAAAVTAALAAQARGRPWWASLFAVAATLTRPEGALVAAVVLGAGLLETRGRDAAAWRRIVAYVVVLALVTVFRVAYYGAPLPNTFYAKVGGVPVIAGVGYLLGFLVDGAGWLVIPAVVGAWADRRTWPGAAFAIAMTAYVVAIGGDAFEQWRFFVPVLPCLAVLAVRGIEQAHASSRTAGIALGATVPLAASQLALGASWSMLLACAILVAAWAAGARGDARG